MLGKDMPYKCARIAPGKKNLSIKNYKVVAYIYAIAIFFYEPNHLHTISIKSVFLRPK